MRRKKGLFLLVLAPVVIGLLFLLNLFCGAVNFSPAEVWLALTGGEADRTVSFIVWESRMPSAVTALLCGAALAVSGLLLQTVFTNPLADPSILGINSGASLGVALVMLYLGGSFMAGSFHLSGFLLILAAAFVGSSVIIALLLLFSSWVKSSLMLLIVGLTMIAVGALGGYLLPDERHLLVRLAGFATGAGLAFTVMAAGVLIWRSLVGETRANESEMQMQDERGQAIAYRAQNALAIAAVGALIVIEVAALVRGDEFYMFLGAALCVLCAAVKFVSMWALGRRM